MFVASAILGMASMLFTLPLKETLPGARPVRSSDLNPLNGPLIDAQAWPAAVVLLPVALAFGVYLTITPDFVDHLGYVYKGSFNTIIVASSISMRFIAGRMSDRYGRIPMMLAGTLLLALGMFPAGLRRDQGCSHHWWPGLWSQHWHQHAHCVCLDSRPCPTRAHCRGFGHHADVP